MLGRKTFSRSEIDRARTMITSQLEAYRELARAVRGDVGDEQPALAEFEHVFFNTLALALDRPFVHRVRAVTGTGLTPLNELELICDSLMTGDGTFRTGGVVKYAPESSLVGLEEGRHVLLTAEQFERLADAVFAELEAKFAEEAARDSSG